MIHVDGLKGWLLALVSVAYGAEFLMLMPMYWYYLTTHLPMTLMETTLMKHVSNDCPSSSSIQPVIIENTVNEADLYLSKFFT